MELLYRHKLLQNADIIVNLSKFCIKGIFVAYALAPRVRPGYFDITKKITHTKVHSIGEIKPISSDQMYVLHSKEQGGGFTGDISIAM